MRYRTPVLVGALFLGSIGFVGCGVSRHLPVALTTGSPHISTSKRGYRYTIEAVLPESTGVQFNIKFDQILPNITRSFVPSMFSHAHFSDHGTRFTATFLHANLWTGAQSLNSGWPRLAFNTEIPVNTSWVHWIILRREGRAIRIICDLGKPAKKESLGTMPAGFVFNFKA